MSRGPALPSRRLPRTVRIAVALNRLLLRSFPTRFRRQHAAPLLQNTTDLLKAQYARSRGPGVFLLWLRLARDLVASGLAERSHVRHSLPTRERLSMLDTLLLDLRYARRTLVQRPQLTILSVLTLALGIGASASMFSVVDGVLLRSLPYPAADRLMSVAVTIPEWEGHEALGHLAASARWSHEEFEQWYERQSSFEAASLVAFAAGNLTGLGEAQRVAIGLTGLDLFSMLGAAPAAGRFFHADDEVSEGHVVVVSWAFWQEQLGGTADLGSQRLRLSGTPYEVVGVLPEGFAVSAEAPLPLWIPIFSSRPGGYFTGNTGDSDHVFDMMATLNDGVSLPMASDETGRLLKAVGGADHFTQHDATIVPYLEVVVGSVRTPLALLMLAVVVVLLVACGNVATFLLGQAIDRRQEIAVRGALGAARRRVARQLMTESVLLSGIAGILGAALAAYGVRVLVALAPAGVPRIAHVALDLRALGFAFGVSLLSGILFGLAPAISLARTDLAGAFRAERFGSAARSRLQSAMVIAEVAAATILLVGAGLLTRSFLVASAVDPGFDPEGVLTLTARPERSRFLDADGEFDAGAMRGHYDRLQQRIAALPGVDAVALAQTLPFSRSFANNNISPEGYEGEDADMLIGQRRFVSPSYLELIGTRLLDGRYLQPADDVAEAASVVVVTERIARRFWPNESAVGRKLGWWGLESEIVGVVADIRDHELTQEVGMQFYAPLTPYGQAGGSLLIRTSGDANALIGSVREAVREVDPDLPISALLPMTERIAGSMASSRYLTRLIVAFAAVAALLAVLGLYGVTSRAVASRTRELGIRLALGAVGRDVVSMMLRTGVRLAVVGTGLGLLVSLAGTRLLEGLLFGVERNDPATIVAIVLIVGALAVAASLIPALRASRVDPVEALRADG